MFAFTNTLTDVARASALRATQVVRLIAAKMDAAVATTTGRARHAFEMARRALARAEQAGGTGATTNNANRDRLRQALNVVLSIVQLVAIAMATATENGAVLEGRSTSEPPVIPAGYAFAIWGYIYPAAIGYAVYQALPSQRENALFRRIGFWTASAYLAMTLWANAVQLGWYNLTVPMIFWMLASLVGALIGIIQHREPLTTAERFVVVPAISVHEGWVTVASIANTASILYANGISNVIFSDTVWANLMLVAAGSIGSFVTLASRGNAGYALAIVWALIGIVVANVTRQPNTAVALVAAGMAALVTTALLHARKRWSVPWSFGT